MEMSHKVMGGTSSHGPLVTILHFLKKKKHNVLGICTFSTTFSPLLTGAVKVQAEIIPRPFCSVEIMQTSISCLQEGWHQTAWGFWIKFWSISDQDESGNLSGIFNEAKARPLRSLQLALLSCLPFNHSQVYQDKEEIGDSTVESKTLQLVHSLLCSGSGSIFITWFRKGLSKDNSSAVSALKGKWAISH